MRKACATLLLLAVAACKPHERGGFAAMWQEGGTAASATAELVAVPLAALGPSVFPCSDCHADRETDRTPRTLETHDEIILRHGESERWCFDCHDPDDRDQLRLANGTLVPLSESHRLCAQCHGERYRDFGLGLHGKRIGSWNGRKEYLLCAACHDPHAPRFKPLAPSPPPGHPEKLRGRR